MSILCDLHMEGIDYPKIPSERLSNGKYIKSTFLDDLDNRISELVKYLRTEAKNAPLLAENAITLLEKKEFQRVSDEEAETVRNTLIPKDSRYMGIFANQDLFVEVYKDSHWLKNQIPKTTHSFARINFVNKAGTYSSSNCFCGLHKESSN